jgi:hypothetical protein
MACKKPKGLSILAGIFRGLSFFLCFFLQAKSGVFAQDSEIATKDADVQKKMSPCSVVVLRALDKVTAKVVELRIKTGEISKFFNLHIHIGKCLKNAPEDPWETLVFVQIKEHIGNDDFVTRFKGWMFASHPAINSLEHPVYDVWIKGHDDIQSDSKPTISDHNPMVSIDNKPKSDSESEVEKAQALFDDPESSPEKNLEVPYSSSDPASENLDALYRGLERSQDTSIEVVKEHE